MSRPLKFAIFAVVAACVLALAAATACFEGRGGIALAYGAPGFWLGVAFWTAVTFLAAAVPVRLANGSTVDLAIGPLVAVMSLGGPAVTAWVALIGTTSLRELRREIPWYGVLANHAPVVLSTVAGALVLQAVPDRHLEAVDFVATVAGALVAFALNLLIVSWIVSLKVGERMRTVFRRDGGAFASMLALAPIAWLMARMYVNAGWWAVFLFAVPLYTTRVAYQRFVAIREMFTQTVSSLAEAVDKRDKFTSGHSHRVQEIAVDIGRVMRLSDEDLEALEWGGLLHDIGKIGVRDSVLLKEQRLTRDERREMNAHPLLGAEIIAPVRMLAPEIPIIRHHHEWFNGSGYPDRLCGDAIPLLARVLHVADAFEAMTAVRPYRPVPLTPEQAVAELRKFGGIQFDPDVVSAFVSTSWATGAHQPLSAETQEVPLLGQHFEASAMISADSSDGGLAAGPALS